MAKPEQTEKATPKRREEARGRGQVPRSSELAGSVIFLVTVFVMHALFAGTFASMESGLRAYFAKVALHGDPTFSSVWGFFVQAGAWAGLGLGVIFAIAFFVGILANVAQFGFLFTGKSLVPSFGKLNPLTGFQNIFSKRIAVNLGKQLIKLFAVAIIIFTSIRANLGLFAVLGQTSPADVIGMTFDLIYDIAWKFGLLLVIVGILDYVYERWQLEENLKMSKNEVKDEYRQSEGNPEAKGAIKRRQRESARRRMMQAVPRATVVVTNPTHFAVALEWDEMKMEAPVVTAKGADLVAKRIRDIAREHGVPILENPPLARTLYDRVELDQAVPPNLYAAVAQVIAFVYKLKRKTIA